MAKTFVVDTNVLLHNADSLFAFADNTVVIPLDVLEELDKFKTSPDDIGRNARQTIRHLDALRKHGSLHEGVDVERTGGRVRVDFNGHDLDLPHFDGDSPDNRIIRTAYKLKTKGEAVTLISKDINCRIKADVLGINAEDFENQKVDFDTLYRGYREATVPQSKIDEAFDGGTTIEVAADERTLGENEYVLLRNELDENHTALTRHKQGKLLPITTRRHDVFGITHRNLQQQMALDLLLDDEVKFLTLLGGAGTGKTLLALAAGMLNVVREGDYDKLLVGRPIMPMGKDIGYLPGSKDEKLTHWMQPIFDNLALLLGNRLAGGDEQHKGDNGKSRGDGKSNVEKRIEQLMDEGIIVLEPLTYIRGRSIPHQFMIVDEAQNLTPHEVKTIVSRVGEGTKIILTGDVNQIDNPYLDSASNGLAYLIERLKGCPNVGHVTLHRSERSALASLAADRL